eukprot:scaffold68467_cov24-Tisochrysis_lutea.AAC.1
MNRQPCRTACIADGVFAVAVAAAAPAAFLQPNQSTESKQVVVMMIADHNFAMHDPFCNGSRGACPGHTL